MANGTSTAWKERLAGAASKERERGERLFEHLIAPLTTAGVLAIFGWYLNILADTRKDVSADRRLFLEQRMKVFIATSEHFEAYRQNFAQLIDIANYEWQQANKAKKLTAGEAERKKRYINDRDKARLSLLADLRAAPLFFCGDVAAKSDAFLKFDGEQGTKLITELPPIEEWAKHQQAILDAMKQEVRRSDDCKAP